MSASRYVVVGAGLAGSSTAWALARRGHEVTVLERALPATPDGSSHGSARIFRYAYADPFYAALVVRARRHWDELEQVTGQRLITPTDALDFGVLRDPPALARVLAGVRVPHEILTADQVRDRWPGIEVDTDALWHGGAGVLDAQSTVLAQLALARRHGARLKTGWDVAKVERAGRGFRLTSTDGDVLDAGHVVVSAGGWLPALLADLPLPPDFVRALPTFTVRQEQIFHFPYRDAGPGGSAGAGWPTFIHKSPAISTYSLPGGRDAGGRGQKVAEYAGGRVLPSAAAQDGRVDPANRGRVVDHVRRRLPGLVPEPYAEATCLFTSTPSEDFVIDGVDGLLVLSPCSGHGAKFAPLLGELAADALEGRASVARFGVGSFAGV